MPTAAQGVALIEACRAQATLLRDFMQSSARPYVERFAARNDEDETIKGAFLRVLAWMNSLARLHDPGDFQSVTAGCRALFEIVVDLVLVKHDPSGYPVAKLVAWERSAKLKQAEKVASFFAHKELPDEHRPIPDFIQREGDAIRAERAKWWVDRKGKPYHPQRWTGAALDLDAEHADRFVPHELRRFYVERFAMLCWSTHGSGLAAVRLIPPSAFPGLAAIPFQAATSFGFVACELALAYFPGLSDDPIVFEKMRRLAEDGNRLAGNVLRKPRAQPTTT